MSDAISPVPLVSLLGAMEAAELLSDTPAAAAPSPAHQQPSPLGQEVELTLSAAALLGSSQAAGSLAQLAGNNGQQLAAQALSNLGSYPLPAPVTTRAATVADTLANLSRPHLLNASGDADIPQPASARSNPGSELALTPQAQLLTFFRKATGAPRSTLISPLVEDPEKLAAATAQSLYLTYAEPLEPQPPSRLARRLILGGVVLVAAFLVLYLVR